MTSIGQQRSSPAHTAGHTTRHSLGAEEMTNLTTMTAEDAKDFRFSNSTAQNPTIFPSDIKLNIVSEIERCNFLSI